MNRIEVNVQTGEQSTVELTVEEIAALLPAPTPEQIEAARVAGIDAEILALEKQAIEQGLIRTVIDDLLIRSQAIAATAGVTEAQLLDPQSEHYSRAFEKVHANATARLLLRAQR